MRTAALLTALVFPTMSLADTGPDYCRESLRTSFIEMATFHVRIKEAVTDAKMAGKDVPNTADALIGDMEASTSAWEDQVIDLAKKICVD